jgi:hypothetical protein
VTSNRLRVTPSFTRNSNRALELDDVPVVKSVALKHLRTRSCLAMGCRQAIDTGSTKGETSLNLQSGRLDQLLPARDHLGDELLQISRPRRSEATPVMPMSSMRCLIAGVSIAAWVISFNLSTMAFGAPLGRKIAVQVVTSQAQANQEFMKGLMTRYSRRIDHMIKI